MVILKTYKCSVSDDFEYIIADELEFYKIRSFHNDRIAIENTITNSVVWIEDNNYGLKTGDVIKFNKCSIKTYDENGYVVASKDNGYRTRIKDVTDSKARYFAIKSLLSFCKELRNAIFEADIDKLIK